MSHQHRQPPQHEQKTCSHNSTACVCYRCKLSPRARTPRHVVECVCNTRRAPGANRPESHTHMCVVVVVCVSKCRNISQAHTSPPMVRRCDAIPRIYPTNSKHTRRKKPTPAATTNYSPYRLRSRRRLTHAAPLVRCDRRRICARVRRRRQNATQKHTHTRFVVCLD